MLDAEPPAPPRDGAARRPPTGRAVDLLWQTDELRLDRPDPVDEARNAIYYLDDLHADAAPRCSTTWRTTLRRLGVRRRRPSARPLTFGTWIGGDRDGNPYVTPAVDPRVLRPPARARRCGDASGRGRR